MTDNAAGPTAIVLRNMWVPLCGSTARHSSIPWARLFHDRNLLLLMLMYHCYCWGAYFYLSWIHTYLQVGRKLTEDQMKVASALPPALGLLGVALGGYLSDRLARKHSLRLARCGVGATGLIVAGICLGIATITADSLSRASASRQGKASWREFLHAQASPIRG